MQNLAQSPDFSAINILFVAGFGPISQDTNTSKIFYKNVLNLPLKPISTDSDYMLTEQDALQGVKHFALWPLSQAAYSCFATEKWPQNTPIPQAWLEFEVENINLASDILIEKNYQLLVKNREEPWGQTVTRLLSPEGLLIGITITPWLRK